MIGDFTSARTAPMAPGGAYDRNSRIQSVGSMPGVDLLLRAAAVVDLPESATPVVIADYGCSTGRNSLVPMAAAIAGVRQRTDQPVAVVHTDRPDNDFATLFETLWGEPMSYASQPGVFPMAIGRSFYHRLMPAESVTLGWSSWSVAWLSSPPAHIPDHVHVSYSADAAARLAYARQSARDWEDFLCARGAEMRAGARLVMVIPAADDDGSAGYRPMFDAVWAALSGFVREGLLDADEAVRMGMPHFGRSAVELAAPFGDNGEFAGLTIERLEVFRGPDVFFDDYESTGDAAAFGAGWAGVFAAGAIPSLATGLSSGPDDPRTAMVSDRLRAEVAARLGQSPQRMRIPIANVVLVKRSGDR